MPVSASDMVADSGSINCLRGEITGTPVGAVRRNQKRVSTPGNRKTSRQDDNITLHQQNWLGQPVCKQPDGRQEAPGLPKAGPTAGYEWISSAWAANTVTTSASVVPVSIRSIAFSYLLLRFVLRRVICFSNPGLTSRPRRQPLQKPHHPPPKPPHPCPPITATPPPVPPSKRQRGIAAANATLAAATRPPPQSNPMTIRTAG